MISEEIYNAIINKVKELMDNARGSHDWYHTERVYNLCMAIGKKEKADMDVLKLAALLHDTGRIKEDKSNGKICHAKYGAQMARKILKEYGIKDDMIKKIVHCIECHRFRGKKQPQSKEAKILYDADKLDSIGAIGIGRAFIFSGEIGATVHIPNKDIKKTKAYSKEDTAYREFVVKLRKIKDKMFTREGRRIAEERHRFMEEFFQRLDKEVRGEL